MIRLSVRSSASFVALAAALGLASAAQAEVTVTAEGVSVDAAASADAGTGSSGQASPEAAGTPSDNSGLTEIVVTATKRETNLQKTPIAISVMAPEAIKNRHVQSLIDLADGVVPSLRVAPFESRQSALTVGIRGIVPFDANQTARDQGVGVYIDGIYLGRQQGLNSGLFDAERIEVLRGPQGTLFGRNTEGGAVSIVTKQPTGEFGGRLTAGIGNFGSYNGELHLDLPAVANVAVKIDGLIQHQDPTTRNAATGQAGWNQFHRVGGRISAQWKPMDGFSLTLSYDQGRSESTPFYSQLINYNPNGLPVGGYYDTVGKKWYTDATKTVVAIAPLPSLVQVRTDRMAVSDIGVVQQPSVDRSHGFTSTLKYKVSPGLELRSITAWRGVNAEQWDNSGGAHRTPYVPNGAFARYSLSDLTQHQFSQELQAVGTAGDLDYAVGLYYFTEKVEESAATPSTNTWVSVNANSPLLNASTPYVFNNPSAPNAGWERGFRKLQRASWAKAHSYAAFFQGTWHATDALNLTVGGRFTKDKREGQLYMVQGLASNFPFTYDNDRFDPMVTLAYEASSSLNLYAKYSTGYRAGGANSRSQTFRSFGPEKVQAYEVGAKMDLLDRRLRINVAGYMMDRTGTQIDFDNVDTNAASPTFNLHTEETMNAPGTSRIRGVEVEMTARPIENLTVGASYAYTYTNVPATANPLLAGNPMTQVFVVYTPRNAGSGYIDYDVPIGSGDAKLRFHIDGNYNQSAYSFQNEAVKADGSFIVNGRIALADIAVGEGGQKVTIAAWARNLLDETHIFRRSNANNATLGSYANLNAPRTFGAEVSMHF